MAATRGSALPAVVLAAFFVMGAQAVLDLNSYAPGLDIWAAGPIAQAVQLGQVYPDSKSFVDQPLKVDPAVAQAAFAKLPKEANGTISNATLVQFLATYFGPIGSDLEKCVPADWVADPPGFLPAVTEPDVRNWALAVNGLWPQLCLRVNKTDFIPGRHTLIPLPNEMIVPGDRFREAYYWDSFWVIKGLLASGMHATAEGIVQNLAYLLQTYGHVLNGARTYYENRSQPPLLSQMLKTVADAHPDNYTELVQSTYELLLEEHTYWTSSPKAIDVMLATDTTGTVYNLSRYHADWMRPRPESYREDTNTAMQAKLDPASNAAEALYTDLASGAESGWDYSSRWFANGKNLTTIQTTAVIPADLNAYLYQMERNLAEFATALNDTATAAEFNQLADQRRTAMNAIMWDPAAGHWNDLHITSVDANGTAVVMQANGTWASNYVPLWVGIAEANSSQAMAVLKSLVASGLLQAEGMSTSLYETGQQWDEPNMWAPLPWMVIEGLRLYAGDLGEALAADMAQQYLEVVYAGYNQTGHMVEKYNARNGTVGGGGEYNVQVGFGWTNGVALDLLNTYGYEAGRNVSGLLPARNITATAPAGAPAAAPGAAGAPAAAPAPGPSVARGASSPANGGEPAVHVTGSALAAAVLGAALLLLL